jgi:hypothetical protein
MVTKQNSQKRKKPEFNKTKTNFCTIWNNRETIYSKNQNSREIAKQQMAIIAETLLIENKDLRT